MTNHYTSELYHHGIKGQKWGVRRFQNSDGSYTSEGRIRRSKTPVSTGLPVKGKKKKKQQIQQQNQQQKSKLETEIDAANMANKQVRKTNDSRYESDRSRQLNESKLNQRKVAEQMSDKELRRAISRAQLEKQYVDLTATDIDPGRDKTHYYINRASDIASLTLTAAQIYATLKGGKSGGSSKGSRPKGNATSAPVDKGSKGRKNGHANSPEWREYKQAREAAKNMPRDTRQQKRERSQAQQNAINKYAAYRTQRRKDRTGVARAQKEYSNALQIRRETKKNYKQYREPTKKYLDPNFEENNQRRHEAYIDARQRVNATKQNYRVKRLDYRQKYRHT